MSFSEPDKIIASINLAKDDHIADIGAGIGFYSFAAAKAVGPNGRVFALDVQKDLLERLKKEATHLGIGNITTVWVDAEKPNGTRLRDHSIHVAIVANILFQVEDKDGLMNEIQRILTREGRVLVVDWTESFGGLGPSFDQVFNQQAATDLFIKYGFHVQATVEAGAHHYGLVFQK